MKPQQAARAANVKPRGRHTDDDQGGGPPSHPVHRAQRPQWNCRACAAPWPCAAGKAELYRQYPDDRVGLLVYLAGLLVDAVHDIDGSPPKALMDRFLGWAKSGGPAGAPAGGPG